MRNVPQAALDAITQPKEVGLRATFRKTLPTFEFCAVTDSLGLTDPAQIDACVYGTGMLRVTSVGNVLYTQYIADIHAPWPAWTNTGIALCPGSRPAVDDGFVWYQKADYYVAYRYFANWSTEVTMSASGEFSAKILAPIATQCCYTISLSSSNVYAIRQVSGAGWTVWGGAVYNITAPRLDAVRLIDSHGYRDYLYFDDRDAGRITELVCRNRNWGQLRPIIPIDAIDDVYGLKLGYAGVIDNKVVITGRLTRTSDDSPVSMDVYAIGPEHFSLGREMFIQSSYNINGKMLRIGEEFVVSGATQFLYAQATTLFGDASHPNLEVTTSEFASVSLNEAENRSTSLDIEMSTDFTHAVVAPGSDVEVEMAYDGAWCKLATCDVMSDRDTSSGQGLSRMVSGVGKSAKRLSEWSPDQGIYIPSQAKMYDFPTNMSQVIRATGRWEAATEDPDAPIILKDLNKLGVLYSTARASRGGAMRGHFYYPSDTYFKPYYGVAVNYYRESAAEAAARLGVEVTDLEDDMFGHNGIVAIYSLTEHGGGPGISLNLWKDSVLTKLTSATLNIPANTWHWLQIDFVEGEVRVKYRPDNNTAWADCITYRYTSAASPWKRETFGRGAVVMKNIMPAYEILSGIGADDTTLAVEDNSIWPTSGTLLIDEEQLTFTGKSNNRTGPWGGAQISFWPGYKFNSAFSSGAGIPVPRANVADNYWSGLAINIFAGHNRGRTVRCIASDDYGINEWVPNDWVSGWSSLKGNTAHGQWYYNDQMGAIYANVDLETFTWHGGEMMTGPFSYMRVTPAIYVSGRGVNGTMAAAHISASVYENVTATLYTSKSVQCQLAACFTQDEDQSVEDALETILRLAGGEASCQALVDEEHVFSDAGLVEFRPGKNFIATMDLPALSTGLGAGMAFRSPGNISILNGHPVSSSGGFYLELERLVGTSYYLTLYQMVAGGNIVLERVPFHIASTDEAAGTLKISVHDTFFSAWLNGRYLHTFYHEGYPDEGYCAFVSRIAATFHIHVSRLSDYLADVVVGTRGNGMSVLADLLGDRHILWRNEPDGSMYFYKDRVWVGNMPDIVYSVSGEKTDNVVSRIRAEGLGISEIMDPDLVREFGNSFATINARRANSVKEARSEARFAIDESWREANVKRYGIVPHPGLQPGDAVTFPGEPAVLVRGLSMTIGFAGNNFVCDMQCDVVCERP